MKHAAKVAAALAASILAGLLGGEVFRCAADARELGPVVRVHPAIRALDAGRR